jgi:hypothetical protein
MAHVFVDARFIISIERDYDDLVKTDKELMSVVDILSVLYHKSEVQLPPG